MAICLDLSFLEAIVGRGNALMDYLTEGTNKLSKLVVWVGGMEGGREGGREGEHTVSIIDPLCLFVCLFRADYLHALDLDPSHLPARVNLAFVLQAEGKFQEAWNELTSALERNKRYVPALEARAIICLQMGNLSESFVDLTTALDVSNETCLCAL